MIPQEKSNSSTVPLLMDTRSMNSATFSDYISFSEDIDSRNKSKIQNDQNVLSVAQLMREELYECSAMDDNVFFSQELSDQNSKERSTQITDLDMTQSMEDVMKYFDEEVHLRSSNSSTPTMQKIGNRVAKAVKIAASPFSKYSKKPKSPTVKDLKAKYEAVEQNGIMLHKKPNKGFVVQNVKSITQMFNNKALQLKNATYKNFQNEISPEPKNTKINVPKVAIYRSKLAVKGSPMSRRKQEQKMLKNKSDNGLVNDEEFRQLSVKDKALIYQKFIHDISAENESRNHSHDHTEEGGAAQRGEVVVEKQKSVKSLAENYEAILGQTKLGVPRPTLSEPLKQLPVPAPRKNRKTKEAEDVSTSETQQKVHISELKVVLKRSTEIKKDSVNKKLKNLPLEPTIKRSNNMIRLAYSTEPYAPPKKIRRTRDERFSSGKIEELLLSWYHNEKGVTFDIKPAAEENDIESLDAASIHIKLTKDTVKESLEASLETLNNQLQNLEIQKNSGKPTSETDESDSAFSTIPKTISEDSQQEQNCIQEEFKFAKPTAPPRKKKFRRSLCGKKENHILENNSDSTNTDTAPPTTTDSDSDHKIDELTKKQQHMFKMEKALKKCNNQMKKLKLSHRQTDDEGFENVFNDPRHIKSAYTLTVLSTPSPMIESDLGETEITRTSSYSGVVRACPAIITTEKSNSPLFVKLNTSIGNKQFKRESSDSACETISSCSTPFRDSPVSGNQHMYTAITPVSKLRRRILSDTEARRNSLATMQVISEGHPLEMRRTSLNTLSERMTEAKLPADRNQATNGQISIYWIIAGDVTISLPIYYNPPDRIRLLLDIFLQKSDDSQDWHFGIDDHKFRPSSSNEEGTICKRLTKKQHTSHYWFSTGDLAVPFNGNYMPAERIKCIFKFLRENLTQQQEVRLRFGIDDFEFSCTSTQAQNLSLDSNYSMLLKLQGMNYSRVSEDHRKSIWTHNQVNKGNIFDKSEINFDQPPNSLDYNCMEHHSSSYEGSHSGAETPFRFSFDNETLDNLFDKQKFNSDVIDEMLERLHQQESKLKTLENKICEQSGLAKDDRQNIISRCQNVPEYVKQLKYMCKIIENLAEHNGFLGCSIEQLEICNERLENYLEPEIKG